MMSRTSQGFSFIKVFSLMLIASTIIWADTQLNSFSKIRSSSELMLVPVFYIIEFPSQLFDNLKQQWQSKHALVLENNRLRDKLRAVQLDNLRVSDLKKENSELHQMLGSVSNLDLEVKLGRVMTLKTDQFSHLMRINLGTKDGVFKGQPVIDAHGVMGIIKHVNLLQSKILLITDSSMAIPISSLRSGARAIAYGEGKSELILKHVPLNADFQLGDTLMTSGLGGSFFAGYPVGIITQINHDTSQKFKTVYVKPQAKINLSRYLFLIGKEDDLKWQRKSMEAKESKNESLS